MEFREHEIIQLIQFVEKYVDFNVKSLTIRHLPTDENNEDGGGGNGILELQRFIQSLPKRFVNLRRLTIDYKVTQQWCEYGALPFLPNTEIITFVGMVRYIDVVNVFKRQYRVLQIPWTINSVGTRDCTLRKTL